MEHRINKRRGKPDQERRVNQTVDAYIQIACMYMQEHVTDARYQRVLSSICLRRTCGFLFSRTCVM
ncbi:hypothetical protein Slin14017_G126300 [Septoria linicola]|nr:hypothetical protein Slin14017_G126300 [Septoria linicola]